MIRRTVATAVGGLVAAVLTDRWLGGLAVDQDGRTIRPPIRSRIEIDAPIGVVWDRLADIERQPEWMAEMKSVRLTTVGPVGVGTRGEATVRILGIAVNDPVEVVEFAPPHRFAIRHDGRFSGDGLITLDTLDGGRRTRVEWAETLIPPILPNLGSMIQAPVLGRIFQADLDRLKDLIEGDRAADASEGGTQGAPLAPIGADGTRPVEAVAVDTNGHGTPAAS